MQRKHVLAMSLAAAAMASVAVYAQKGGPSKHEIIEAVSPDLPVVRARQAATQQKVATMAAKAADAASKAA